MGKREDLPLSELVGISRLYQRSIRVDADVLAEIGLHLSEQEIIDRFVGRSPAVMREAIERHHGGPLPDDWLARSRSRYTEAFARELRPIDGIEDALDAISAATCVASSSEPDELAYKLELTGLYERFAGRIFSAVEVRNGKPAPDLFLHAAARMGVDPADCVVVEDSVYGVRAGVAAGMTVHGYAGGLTAEPELAAAGARTFGRMAELVDRLR